jgi:hypothetical protein
MNFSDVRIGPKANCPRQVQLVNAFASIISTDSGIAVREREQHSRNPLITKSSCLKQNHNCEGGDNSESDG